MNYGQPYQPPPQQPPPSFQNPNQNSSTMKYLLIGGIVLLFLMAIGAVVIFLVHRSDGSDSADEDETSESEEKEDKDKTDSGDEEEAETAPTNEGGSSLGGDDFNTILNRINFACETQSKAQYVEEVIDRHYWQTHDIEGLDIAQLLSQNLEDPFLICQAEGDYARFGLYTISDYRRVQEIAKEIQERAWPALSESDCRRSTEEAQEDFERFTLVDTLEVGGRIFESSYAIPQLEEALDAENIDYKKPEFIRFCD